MRSLAIMFFFVVLIFGIGTILISANSPAAVGSDGSNLLLGQFTSGNQQTSTAVSTEVDRDDDSRADLACTPEPNDCNLRSAITIANNDGKPTTITFADSYLIRLTSPLPALTADSTVIKAAPGQEVHLNGNGTSGSVLRLTGAHAEIQGLRIYGAGAGYPNIAISENAYDVVIANNVIGDDDAPNGNCGSSEGAYGGIYVDATGDFGDGKRAWIYGNIIECHRGFPGDGITILSDKVLVGKDHEGNGSDAQQNIIRLNNGFGVNVGSTTGNTVCYNKLAQNVMGGLYVQNFHNNNIMFNDITDPETIIN